MTGDEDKKLNPQITEFEIGIRDLRKITIYPLSIHDQTEMGKLLQSSLKGLYSGEGDVEDAAFIDGIVGLVRENLPKMIELVADEKPGEVLKDMTNVQAMALAQLIYEMNFEDLVKKVRSLLEMIPVNQLLSGRSPQPSANDTDTDSKTSIESPSETED